MDRAHRGQPFAGGEVGVFAHARIPACDRLIPDSISGAAGHGEALAPRASIERRRTARYASQAARFILHWDGINWIRAETQKQGKLILCGALKNQQFVPTSAAVAHLLIARYLYWTSPNDQAQELRAAGIEVARSDLARLIRASATRLAPLADAMRSVLCESPFVAAANRPVGSDVSRRLWGYVGLPKLTHAADQTGARCPRAVASLRLTLDRTGAYAAKDLASFRGFLFAAREDGYDAVVARPTVRRIGCWSAVRSSVARLGAEENHPVSVSILRFVDTLTEVEKALTGATSERRVTERQQRTALLLDRVHATLANALRDPATPEAIRRFARLLHDDWAAYRAFLDDGRIAITSGAASEMVTRYGDRRGWVLGSDVESHAAFSNIATTIETCRLNDVDPAQYLTAMLGDGDRSRWPMPWEFSRALDENATT